MAQKKTLVISSADQLLEARTRRDFLKVIGVGGVLVMLPTAMSACGNDTATSPKPGTGNTVTIDFSKGDIAVLQFAYALEQLEADFYTKAVAAFGSSSLTATVKAVIQDIKYH